jgi:hypothetical protein
MDIQGAKSPFAGGLVGANSDRTSAARTRDWDFQICLDHRPRQLREKRKLT